MSKKTIVIGATTNPDRYAYKAVVSLLKHNHVTFPLGIKSGEINGEKIIIGKPDLKDIDTITLYIGAKNQPEWYEYVIGLKPKRVIFNPGAENPEFVTLLQKSNIPFEEACTLVMLSIGTY